MENNFSISGIWQSVCDLWFPIAVIAVGVLITVLLILFLMKKKWIGMILMLALAALMVGGGIVYRLPHSIINVNASDVSKIAVSDVEITDTEIIEDILQDLSRSEYKRTLPSGIGGSQEYCIRIYDKNGEIILSLGIADEYMIDTGIFWEKRESGAFNLNLYQSIVKS